MTGIFSIADAIDRHQIRLMWAGQICIAFAYPPGRSNAISGSGPTVRDAVRELVAGLSAFEQRRTEKRPPAQQAGGQLDAYR
ncbi:MAG: hypothetical protein ACKVX9_08900 [Blastocatellia bacterium]